MATILDRLLNKPAGKYPARFPEDIRKLKDAIPELHRVDDLVIETLYSNWSEDNWSAGWLIMTPGVIEDFKAYLESEI